MKQSTLKLIEKHLTKARSKHSEFAETNYQIISIATEELGELAQAVNDGKITKTKSEAADLIAVMVRLIEGD